jgi:DNA helicase-2/ATP-dependent DNA helicase PcrA
VIGLPGKGAVDVAPTGWSPARPPKARPVPSVAEGDTVLHERWGEGVVLTVKGQGDDAEATISFANAGEKRLLLSYAPLTRVG